LRPYNTHKLAFRSK
jgi:hypothetical protein